MICLSSGSVAARLDPDHGAEILDFIDLRSGRQLLARAPFSSMPPVSGEVDQETWTRSYRGGWQLLCPNAGRACEVDGVAHGYHGCASSSQWKTTESARDYAELAWKGHGIRVARRVTLQDDAIVVRSIATAERAVPIVWVEHLGFGIELLDPTAELDLAGGSAYEVNTDIGPAVPPADAGSWPEVRLHDGTLERADRATLATPHSRMYVVADVPAAHVRIYNPERRQGVEINWDPRHLPHVWVWHEARKTGGPWRQLAEALLVEPASVPHPLGLATARELGQAYLLEPGQEFETEIIVRAVFDG